MVLLYLLTSRLLRSMAKYVVPLRILWFVSSPVTIVSVILVDVSPVCYPCNFKPSGPGDF